MSFNFWMTTILFGGGGLFMLVRLLNPKNLFVTLNLELGNAVFAEQIKNQKETLGFFIYDEKGFYFDGQNGALYHNWTDINTIFGYKKDHINTDEICLDIFMSDNICIELTEDMPGWYMFNKALIAHFLTISTSWEEKIVSPSFKANLTLLYDKTGRTKEQAEADCYKGWHNKYLAIKPRRHTYPRCRKRPRSWLVGRSECERPRSNNGWICKATSEDACGSDEEMMDYF